MTLFVLECEFELARPSVEEIMSANVTFKIKCFVYFCIRDGVIFNLKSSKVNDNASAGETWNTWKLLQI